MATPTVGQRVIHRRYGAGIVVHAPATGFILVRFDGPIAEHRVHRSALQPEQVEPAWGFFANSQGVRSDVRCNQDHHA